jgi:hypothetical protein
MIRVFRSLAVIGLLAGLSSFAGAASMTMKGVISDSECGTSHAKMIAGGKMTNRECTLACVKAGAKFVFVSDGKVYNISNQNLAALTQNAGEAVSLTGDVKGDTITVSKVAMSGKKK